MGVQVPSVLWHCWLGGRKGIRPVKNSEWWGAGVVICLEWGADLHTAQLMPLPLTVSCFSKTQIGLPFWYRLTWVVPDKGPLNGCVCVCVMGIQLRIVIFDYRLFFCAHFRLLESDYCLWNHSLQVNSFLLQAYPNEQNLCSLVGRYQKKHSPTHIHPDHRTSFIIFLHLQWSMASSLFILRAW